MQKRGRKKTTGIGKAVYVPIALMAKVELMIKQYYFERAKQGISEESC